MKTKTKRCTKILILLLAICAVAVAFTACGLKYDVTFRSNSDGKGYDVAGIGLSKGSDVVIPATFDGKPVTGIGNDAFKDYTKLTSIVIPDSVTSIGENAFSGCSSLTSIVIPNSVTSIGENAFFNYGKLQYNEYDNAQYLGNETNPFVVLLEAKDSHITSCEIAGETKFIGEKAFQWCESLTSIVIPDSVTSIGKDAFDVCSKLTNITFKGTIEQWNNIEKESYWDIYIGDYTVHCTDGDIRK